MWRTLALVVTLLLFSYASEAWARDLRTCTAMKLVELDAAGDVDTSTISRLEIWVSGKTLSTRQVMTEGGGDRPTTYYPTLEMTILQENKETLRAFQQWEHGSTVFTLNKKTGKVVEMLTRDGTFQRSPKMVGRVTIWDCRQG